MPTNASFVTPFTPPPPWVLNLYIHIIYCILNDWRQNLHAHRETYYNICVLGLFIYMGNPILSPYTNDIWIFWRFFCSFTPKSHPMIHGSQLVLHRLLPLQTRTLLYKRHVLKINETKCSKFGNHHGLDMIVNIMWGMMMGGGPLFTKAHNFEPSCESQGWRKPNFSWQMHWVFGFYAKTWFVRIKPWCYSSCHHTYSNTTISGHWALDPIISICL